MSTPETILAAEGIEIGPPIPPIGAYSAVVRSGSLLFTSGVVGLQAPDWDLLYAGRFGDDLSAPDAAASARAAMISTLANVRGAVGSLDAIARVVRVTGYVQTTDAVMGLPGVLNGATELLAQLWPAAPLPARTAVGVRALPGNASVELECVLELA